MSQAGSCFQGCWSWFGKETADQPRGLQSTSSENLPSLLANLQTEPERSNLKGSGPAKHQDAARPHRMDSKGSSNSKNSKSCSKTVAQSYSLTGMPLPAQERKGNEVTYSLTGMRLQAGALARTPSNVSDALGRKGSQESVASSGADRAHSKQSLDRTGSKDSALSMERSYSLTGMPMPADDRLQRRPSYSLTGMLLPVERDS